MEECRREQNPLFDAFPIEWVLNRPFSAFQRDLKFSRSHRLGEVIIHAAAAKHFSRSPCMALAVTAMM
jgi:hypothetical protein